GGDENKRRDYPCRPVGICIDRPQVGFQGKGSLWIDDVALLSPRKESHTLHVQVRPPSYGNLYAVGDDIALKVRGNGQRIRWSVADFWNRKLAAGQGPATATEARFHLDKPGYFACKLELLAGDRVIETEVFHLAALLDLRSADLPGGKTPVRSDFVGICSHFGQRAYPLPCMELMRRYGIDQFRDEIHWRVYEAQKGRHATPDYPGYMYVQFTMQRTKSGSAPAAKAADEKVATATPADQQALRELIPVARGLLKGGRLRITFEAYGNLIWGTYPYVRALTTPGTRSPTNKYALINCSGSDLDAQGKGILDNEEVMLELLRGDYAGANIRAHADWRRARADPRAPTLYTPDMSWQNSRLVFKP
ncbi:hypothetical protein LCGC14_3008610, partial [marine sediment metagenome]